MTRFEVLPHFLDMIPIRGLNASPHSTADDTSLDGEYDPPVWCALCPDSDGDAATAIIKMRSGKTFAVCAKCRAVAKEAGEIDETQRAVEL